MISFDYFSHPAFINFVLMSCVFFGILIYKLIFPKKNTNLLFLLILIAIIPTLSLFRPGTFQAGDLQIHTAQLIDFFYNLRDGIILPRWAGDMCGGYGCPVYVIEYILPYYFGSFFHMFGFSFLTSIKLVLATAFIASGITMYLWAKDEFGEVGGFVAAIFYLFAPYHLMDVHFRGSIGEVCSFIFIPLLFLFTKKIIETNKLRYFFFLAISVVLILLSHSSTTLISLPLAFGYGIVVWWRKSKKKKKEIVLLFFSFVYGILLCSFYWLPAIAEVKYTWWIFTNFGDFKPLAEYLFSPARFGLLFQGLNGELRLIVGYFHLLVVFLGVILLFKHKKDKKHRLLLFFFLASFFLLFFMMNEISKPIWQHVSLLHTFIMVWRLLVPISFLTAAIAAIVVTKIKNKVIILFICYVVITSTVLNWANRQMITPLKNPLTAGDAVYTQYFEENNPIYEEQYKKEVPKANIIAAQQTPEPVAFLKGNGKFIQLKRTQEHHEYIINASNELLVRENTRYFPGWNVFVNNKKVPVNYENKQKESFGILTFSLKKGLYKVDVIFSDTPIRSIGKKVSSSAFFAGISVLIAVQILKFKRKKVTRWAHFFK